MRLHREGTPTLLLSLAVIGAALAALWFWALLPVALRMVLSAVLLTMLFIIVYFFRVPERVAVLQEDAVLSPADGKVVAMERVYESEYFKEERIQLSVFMSPLNVHINYYPISGSVAYYRYHPGKYLVAWHPKSSTDNERSTVVVRSSKFGSVLFRQIAGALARRICTYSLEGENAEQGTEFGFIKFGSRVDLLLPVNARIEVELGQVVKGAHTVLARLLPEEHA